MPDVDQQNLESCSVDCVKPNIENLFNENMNIEMNNSTKSDDSEMPLNHKVEIDEEV